MRALVTGIAGFIGSHLAERLLTDGHTVRGIDCLTPYYDVGEKRANLEELARLDHCEIVVDDLGTCEIDALLDGIDVIFHQAGQPGVRASWRDGFGSYVQHNILATQRLLEAAKGADLERFVFASSSSVYGDAPRYPTRETDLPAPQSPYGVTKLAAEHLCGVYARNWDVPTVSLRYFTVYGPRQRPDMAMRRLVDAALAGRRFPMYGDGSQVRDFTFVADVVEGNLLAASKPVPPGTVINVAGGSSVTLREVIDIVGELCGSPVNLDRRPAQPGDVRRTGGSTEVASSLLGWGPTVDVRDGLARQIEWQTGPGMERAAV
jgi:nucleoside-diphosphate-sugar epimerase